MSKDCFNYVYGKIKKDVHLSSISGGTDIVSCFILGNIYSPVICGEIQNNGLGMDVDIFDDHGKPVIGIKKESWFVKILFRQCQLNFGMI